MPIDANAVTQWAADRLLTGSVEGAIVITLVWVATRRIPKMPASLQATLWWLAALKLVLTLLPLPAVPIPLLPADTRSIAFREDLTDSAIAARAGVRAPSDASAGGVRQPGATTPAANAGSGSGWVVGLVALWFGCLALRGVRLLLALRTLRAVVRRSVSPIPADTALVAQLAEVAGLTSVPQVRASDDIDTPQLAGLRRPIVLVPTAAAAPLTPDQRAMALCHELIHVRRHDLALGWVPALAEHLFFFHPLARLAAREYVTAREAACDAAVVRALGVAPKEYAQLLMRVGVGRPCTALVVGGASPSMSSLRRRLTMLQDVQSTALPRRSMWCLAAAIAVSMMPLQLVARTPSNATPLLSAAVPAEALAQEDQSASVEQQRVEERRKAVIDAQRKRVAEVEALQKSRLEEQAAVEDRRRAAVERQRTLIEALQRSRLQEHATVEERRAQVVELQKSISERLRRASEILEQRKRDEATSLQSLREAELRLEAVRRQLAQLDAEQQALRVREQESLEAVRHHLTASTRAQSGTYSRGDMVTLTPAADGTRPPDSRVLALAGDRLQVGRAGIVVNGVPVADLSREFLADLANDHWDQTVPPGHYFVAGEQRSESSVIRFWGLLPAERIAGRP